MSFVNSDSATEPSVDFRAAFEVMPGNSALLLANPPIYTTLAVTEDFVRTTGMKRENLVGKGHFESFPENPADPDSNGEENIRASLDYVISHKVPHQLAAQRYDIPNGDGTFTEHYWQAEHRPVLNQRGEVAYIIQTSVEITNQVKSKQQEAKIREIEKAYNLFMQTPVIIGIVKGDDYMIELANEELLIVWDRTSEVVGKPLFEAIPELQEQGFRDLLDQVRTTGTPFYANEFPIDLARHGKRELRYLDFVYKPFYESSTDTVASGVFALGHDVTEQVWARQKIKESEEEIRLAIEIAELGTFHIDLLTNTATYSERVMEWLGLPHQGMDLATIFGTVHPDDQQRIIESIRQTTQSLKNSRHDLTYKVTDPKTGVIRHLHSVGETMYNEQQQPYQIVGVIQDVSTQINYLRQKEENEKELKRSNERFELITRATSDAIWDWNIPEDKIYFNEAYTQLFGYDASVLPIDRAWSSHMHENDKQRITDSLQEAFSDPSVLAWQEEYRFVRADGSVAYVHDRGIILRNQEGQAVQMVGAMLDITERKQFEATLAQSEEQFRTLANSIFQLAWIADANGWIHWYNDRWYEYTGTNLEEMEGWGWEKVHHPDHIERVVAFVKEAWTKGEPWELTFPLLGKDSTYRWFLTRGVPVKDKEGKVTKWIGTNTDIDAQKQAEVLLEEKVKERTLELENKTRELEQFTYVSHHDLKEPIRKIQIFTEMIKSDSYHQLSEASRKRLDRVSDSAQRMNAALTDVLNFAGLNQEEQPRQIDTGEVLAAVQMDLELLITENNALVTVSDLPTIEAVYRQIHQLFYNLLSNALKFAKPGVPAVITVTCQKLTAAQVAQHPDLDRRKNYYEFEVKDNGIGFGQNYADKIFVIFQRLHSKDAYSGTGIGLALAKKVVLKHGGKIWAESQEGDGATFKIILPASWSV